MKPPITTELVTTAGTTPNSTTIPSLVRRLDDFEVPAAGTWPVVRTSHVAIARGRADVPIPASVLNGAFEIADRPEHSTIHLDLGGPEAMTLVGRPTSVVANRHGFSEWSIAGTLTAGGWSAPITFTVSYHGVHRSRGRSWAWFSGSGAVESPVTRSWWRRSTRIDRLVVLDLLLDSPASPGSPSAARRAA